MISYKDFDPKGIYVGRIWRPDVGPTLVRIEGENVFDITSRDLHTMHDLLEVTDPAATARATKGVQVTVLDALVESSLEAARTGDANALRLLAPPDLQAIKASGVTFAESMV